MGSDPPDPRRSGRDLRRQRRRRRGDLIARVRERARRRGERGPNDRAGSTLAPVRAKWPGRAAEWAVAGPKGRAGQKTKPEGKRK